MGNGPVVSRFYYSTCTVGVGAVLTSPPGAESWASSSLPIIGGHSASEASNVAWPSQNDPVLRFDLARTEITGSETTKPNEPQEFTTTVRKKVVGLNILNRVIGSFDVTLTFKYHVKARRELDEVEVIVSPAEPYSGVTIHGAALPKTITFNQILFREAGRNFKGFRPAIINRERPGVQHLKHPQGEAPDGHGQGIVYTALAEPIRSPKEPNGLIYEDSSYGRVDVPDLGRVYFGEWWSEPYRQNFTFLRVELKGAWDRLNRKSTFTGEIVIDDENGRGG